MVTVSVDDRRESAVEHLMPWSGEPGRMGDMPGSVIVSTLGGSRTLNAVAVISGGALGLQSPSQG